MTKHPHLSEQAFYEIADAIFKLRVVFQKYHLKPPKAIELATLEDGRRLLLSMPKGMMSYQPRLGESPEMVANIGGVEIIYPAQIRAERNGGWRVE